MLRDKATIEYGIVGLGRFGFALAQRLAEAGKEVLVIDCNEAKIRQIRMYTENAFVARQLDKDTLAETGIQNCKTVVVCIGEKIDASILTTLNIIQMGVPRVIAKAISHEQGAVLETLGAEVIYPERDMAIRLGNKLLYSEIDYMEIQDKIMISKFEVPEKVVGKSLVDLNVRKKFNLNIIAITSDHETLTEISPSYVVKRKDILVVVGNKENIMAFEEYLNKQ